MTLTPSRLARLAAGLSAIAAARRAGVTARYLMQCESAQCFGRELARRLARCYGCDTKDFLPQPDTRSGRGTQSTKKPAGSVSRPAGEGR